MSVQALSDGRIEQPPVVWRPTMLLAILIVGAIVALVLPVRDGMALMWDWWTTRPEYSHGILMPFIAAFLVWQQHDRLQRLPFTGSWWGVALAVVGAVLLLLGKLASVLTLQQYAYVVVLAGLVWSLVGTAFARLLVVPLVVLILMIPLPEFVFNNLTSELQLISSKIGVGLLRVVGVSVFLEGNVVDLGAYKLEVAEACSGLRYLFPLMTLGFLMAYFFKAAFWKRALVFASSVPLTIGMNGLRIAIIGLLVDRFGTSMAEGFLHDFEGWVVFMASGGVLLLEIVLLSRVGRDRRPWRTIFGLEFPAYAPRDALRTPWRMTAPFMVSGSLVVLLVSLSLLSHERREFVPPHASLAELPTRLDDWRGRRSSMDSVSLAALQLDDYVVASYDRGDATPINLYIAWYESQRAGRSAHSPRSCLPGGGWRIESLTQTSLASVKVGGVPLIVNRAVIAQRDSRQVVYYWFQQRGRVITNEYAAKWYLFWDSLRRNRSDGALVRLIAPVAPGASPEQADRSLTAFAATLAAKLPRYVPG
jgi:exosortase D (VPLPA-CTERM-specific)